MIDYMDFEYGFTWTSNTKWMMPSDEKLFQNQFAIVDEFIDTTLAYIPKNNREVCIQAGACIGLWPIKYSNFFEKVITFEPLLETYNCAVENIKRCNVNNIDIFNRALGPNTKVKMKYSKEKNLSRSYGAYHVVEATDGMETMPIDDIPLNGKRVSHIQLDVEGYELKALKSAQNVIKTFRPVIVIEQRSLSHLHTLGVKINSAKEWLENEQGYIVKERIGNDFIMISK